MGPLSVVSGTLAAAILGLAVSTALAEPLAADASPLQLAAVEVDGQQAKGARPAAQVSTRADDADEYEADSAQLFDSATLPPVPSNFSVKWAELRRRLASNEKVLARCRLDPRDCPPAAQAFLRIVDMAREYEGRARIGQINRAVNLQIRPMSDEAQYGVPDFWSSPLETFAAGAGDCEDYAIAKYVALRHAGVAREDLRLMIVRDLQHATTHAVTAVRHEGQWLLLDNRTLVLASATEARHYRMLFAMRDDRGNEGPAAAGRLSFEASAPVRSQ